MHVAEYTWRLEKGHPVIKVGGKPYLLSTGSSRSVGNEPILLEPRDIDPRPSHLGVTVASLRKRLGGELAGMLGCDLLSPYTVSLYPEEHIMRLSEAITQGDIALPVSVVKGAPVVKVEVAGRHMSLLLDLAAAVSLLPEPAVHGSDLQGKNLTFHPLVGSFNTQHYTAEICVGGECRLFRVGLLPESLDEKLGEDGIEGVLGVDLLQHFGLSINLGQKVIKLGRRSMAVTAGGNLPPLARQAM